MGSLPLESRNTNCFVHKNVVSTFLLLFLLCVFAQIQSFTAVACFAAIFPKMFVKSQDKIFCIPSRTKAVLNVEVSSYFIRR